MSIIKQCRDQTAIVQGRISFFCKYLLVFILEQGKLLYEYRDSLLRRTLQNSGIFSEFNSKLLI